MYVYNHGTGNHVPQGYAPGTAPGYGINPAFVPPPGFITTAVPSHASSPGSISAPTPARHLTPVPFPGQVSTPRHTPTPPAPALAPVQVPPGYYPIELCQFWRGESKRGQPFPLHWALFVRTASSSPRGSTSTLSPSPMYARAQPSRTQTPQGNFYELVGTPDTYTAQSLSGVTFSPETLPDWRGTHIIGWVHPSQLGTFERIVRQVPVWRRRPEWRCQQWVYEVLCALGTGNGREGVFAEGCSMVVLQKQMGWLLEAWERGDI